jgi:hypothetical protein
MSADKAAEMSKSSIEKDQVTTWSRLSPIESMLREDALSHNREENVARLMWYLSATALS